MSINPSDIRVPTEFAERSDQYKQVFLEQWDKDYQSDMRKYAILSWVVPLIIILGTILLIIVDNRYPPSWGFPDPLISGINWTIGLLGTATAIWAGMRIGSSVNIWCLGCDTLENLQHHNRELYDKEIAARNQARTKRTIKIAEATRKAMIALASKGS